MGFWEGLYRTLRDVSAVTTADELIAVLNQWHEPRRADAYFPTYLGGDERLIYSLNGSRWSIERIDGDIHWKAVSNLDGSIIEHVEGDVYRRCGGSREARSSRECRCGVRTEN